MLGESSVVEGRVAAALGTAAGGSPSTGLAEREPNAADATADSQLTAAPAVPDYSRTASAPPVAAGRASSRSPSYRVHDGAACVQCGGERPVMAVKHGDGFCTTKCARSFYGCPLDPATERPQPKIERLAA
jgi:hypothetical protein